MERRSRATVVETLAPPATAAAAPRSDAEALQAALERIVLLECRVDQLNAVAAAEREQATRARAALSAQEAREAQLGKRMSELESLHAADRAENAELSRRLGIAEAGRSSAEAHAHARGAGLASELSATRDALELEKRRSAVHLASLADARARIELLEGARERLFGKLVEWQHLSGAASAESIDLAEFIAELRSEILLLERTRVDGERRESFLRQALERAGQDPDALLASELSSASLAADTPTTTRIEVAPAPAPRGAERAKCVLDEELEAAIASAFPEVEPSIAVQGEPASSPVDVSGQLERGGTPLSKATRLAAEGRLRVGLDDATEALAELPSAPIRALALRLTAELLGGPDALRVRAASRLVQLAKARAAPAIAAATGLTSQPQTRAALLDRLGQTDEPRALPVARRLQQDTSPDVRAAALEASARLAASDETELLAALREGLADEDARVRRRAALCAASSRGLDAGLLLVPILSDPDAQARRLACAALGGTRDPTAGMAVLGALLDREPSVRSAAAHAAAQLFGEDAAIAPTLSASQRIRAVTRLRAHVAARIASLAPDGKLSPRPRAPLAIEEELQLAAQEVSLRVPPELMHAMRTAGFDAASSDDEGLPDAPAQSVEDAARCGPDARLETENAREVARPRGVEQVLAPTEDEHAAQPAAGPYAPMLTQIEDVLRSALRGATEDSIADELGCDFSELSRVVALHVQHGRLVRRGRKLYLP